MKRKLIAILAALLLLPVLLMPAAANSSDPPLIIDRADLLTDQEEAELESVAKAVRSAYSMDVVILTVNYLYGQQPQDYADDYYDNYGYGVGDDNSGVLLLLSMEERDWYISTCGDAIYALTDYGIQASMETPLAYLGQGMYYAGFQAWLNELPTYFDAFQAGTPIDGYAGYFGNYYHGDRDEVVYYEDTTPSLILSLLAGMIVAGISVLVMRGSMNTKVAQSSAGSYLKPGSFHLRNQQDIFLYSRVTKTAKASTSTKSGGGSSVHTSSGGHSHGGGGGKF